MPPQSGSPVRHRVRPLNVFSFCGEPIAVPRGEYHLLTRDLPPCPECQRACDKVALELSGKYRRLM